MSLYEQTELLKRRWCVVLSCIIAGDITNWATVYRLVKVFGTCCEIYVTMLPHRYRLRSGWGLPRAMSGLAIGAAGMITVAIAPMFAVLI